MFSSLVKMQDDITNYFAPGGKKAPLANKLHNFYARRITSYKTFLIRFFPADVKAAEDSDQILQHNNRNISKMKIYRATKKKAQEMIDNIDNHASDTADGDDSDDTDIINTRSPLTVC